MNKISYILKKNAMKIYLFTMIIVILSFADKVPYVNIFVSPVIILTLIYVVAVMIFRLSVKANIILAVVFLIISIPWLLVGSRVSVENLGVLSFLALFIASIKKAKEVRNRQ